MMSHGRLVFSTLFFVLFTSACAQSNTTKWANLPVQIYSDSNLMATSSSRSDLQDAMDFWEQRAGRKLFDFRGVWNQSAKPFSGTASDPVDILVNMIFYQNPWPASIHVIGQTVVTSLGNEIQSAMIMLNPDVYFCSGDCEGQYFSNSARKNLTHELGHFIGMNHAEDLHDVMYPILQPGGTLKGVGFDEAQLRELTSD